MIVSGSIFSAFISSLAGGSINNMIGRRKTIMTAAALFIVGSLVMFTAHSTMQLVVGEILLGLGIGIESLTSPIYIAEIAKPSMRGVFVSMYGLLMCLGQFLSGMIDGIFGEVTGGWRFMFGLAVVPGAVMLYGFVGLPESPSWLIVAGRHSEAEEILKTIRVMDSDVMDEMMDIEDTLKYTGWEEKVRIDQTSDYDRGSRCSVLHQLLNVTHHPPTRRALVLGCGLMVLQQVCGPNVASRNTGLDSVCRASKWIIFIVVFTALWFILSLLFICIQVMYYAASIYRMAGFSGESQNVLYENQSIMA